MDNPVADGSKQQEKRVSKSLKRKRITPILESVSVEEKEARIDGLKQELDGLIQYFKEVLSEKVNFEGETTTPSSINSVIACLLEESDLPFSKLVEDIYERVKSRQGVTLASVRSTVLLVGQRSMYGVANADADVLEDSSENCLWCWETRDLKLMPKKYRGTLNIRRTCRKKIHERITAVFAMISSLQMLDSHPNYKADLMKASEKLVKALKEAAIRRLVESLAQKSGAETAEKEAKLKEKGLNKELERNKRELEKERRRMDREQLKEKLQNEKELKRLQDEAEKEEKRREKEEAEMRKQLKRQQEEAEKEQRRKEKEEAEQRKRLSIQKQATIMERFLKSKKNNSGTQDDSSSTKGVTSDSSKKGVLELLSAVTSSMDAALHNQNAATVDDLLRSHRESWNKVGRSIRSGSSKHWGIRHKPKTVAVKELKLHCSSSETGISGRVTSANKGFVCSNGLNTENVVDGCEEDIPDDRLCNNSAENSQPDMRVCNRIKKLLQFDKSPRPAYYGTLSVKSDVVEPCHPLKKDPNLDYEVESDEEWEEEDPGESLSDCDKEDDEETLEEGNQISQDEDGSGDGFLVPDGYLSENEGVQVDSMEIDDVDQDVRNSPKCKEDVENEGFRALFQQQKYINNLTEHALKKNQPLIISNLMHEKTAVIISEGLGGSVKIEQKYLQALSIRLFSGGQPIEISIDHSSPEEDQDVCPSLAKGSPMPSTPSTPVASMLDKDLPKIVGSIQSCAHGINKVVESLQQTFPSVPKSQLRNKVREISDFVDNRWQVKKEILDKLGLSVSSGKHGERTKGIAAFFSKRCMPPAGQPIKTEETSPEPCCKPETSFCHEQSCTENLLQIHFP